MAGPPDGAQDQVRLRVELAAKLIDDRALAHAGVAQHQHVLGLALPRDQPMHRA
jgi:hypothetical protein